MTAGARQQRRQAFIFGGGNREVFAARVRARLAEFQTTDTADVDKLQTKLAGLDREIQHGTKRLLRAPEDVADLLAGELSTLRKERDRIAGEFGRG